MKKITFLGAAGMVTGSSYLFEDQGVKILVDMGSFQGTPEEEAHNYDPLGFDPKELTAIILTHAHLDHCGRLPYLIRLGFKGHIYMTPATRALLEITLMDSAKIASANSQHTDIPPLYDESHVGRTLDMAVTIEYHTVFEIGKYAVLFKDAGHILGSASVLLTDTKGSDIKNIVFSGDLGNSPQDLIRPTEYFDEADVVVMESTYGDKNHPLDDPGEIISSEIQQLYANGGTLLIPAFSIERTQVLLHMIGHLKESGSIEQDLPIFLDSPMAEKITTVYRDFPQLYNDELQAHVKKRDPFEFPGLQVIESHKQSLTIKKTSGPKVIIAGSGMMSGGRILTHAREYLPNKSTRLLFVGYQAVGTNGRKIKEGEKIVWIYGQNVEVNASINEATGLSAHADQQRLLTWLKHMKGVRHVFLTHGEEEPRAALSEKIKQDANISHVTLPKMHEECTL